MRRRQRHQAAEVQIAGGPVRETRGARLRRGANLHRLGGLLGRGYGHVHAVGGVTGAVGWGYGAVLIRHVKVAHGICDQRCEIFLDLVLTLTVGARVNLIRSRGK